MVTDAFCARLPAIITDRAGERMQRCRVQSEVLLRGLILEDFDLHELRQVAEERRGDIVGFWARGRIHGQRHLVFAVVVGRRGEARPDRQRGRAR